MPRGEQLLEKFLEINGVDGVYIFSRDGFVVAQEGRSKVDTEALAASVTSVIGAGEVLGRELDTSLNEILLQYKTNNIIAANLGEDLVVTILGKADMNIGMARLVLKRNLSKLEEAFMM